MRHKKPITALGVFSLVAGAACTSSSAPPSPAAEQVGKVSSALFTNGDFESGTNNQAPPSWTVTRYYNPDNGVSIQTPQTRAGLNLATTGNPAPTSQTFTLVAAGPETQTDADLGSTASLRWPKFGNAVAVVNQKGKDHNVNSMKQTMTVGAGDIDGVDGLAHVRFVVAPVLQDPGHDREEQPYFFVQLTNLTKGSTILYQDFNFANQSGVPWKATSDGSIKYTDWALIDIAPGSAKLAPGDQVELEIIAAGCSKGGHWGHVYVDGIGATVPGVFVSATGPSAANQNTDITYVLTYKNAGATAAGGVVVEFNTPPGTTFSSFTAPGLTCTAPAAGAAGLVRCTVGSLAPGAGGSFPVTVHINNGTAPGTVTAGNYNIQGTNISPLLGPKVYTSVTDGVTYANLGVTMSSAGTSAPAGGTVTYTIEVTNAGPSAANGATVTDTLPPQLSNAMWTCVGTGGATCTAAGNGSINDSTTTIPVGGKLTYTITATVSPTATPGQLANIASVTVPAGVTDPDPSNNSVGNYKPITAANGTGCAANAECTSGVCNPADQKCGYPSGTGPCTAANGATICRDGACSANGTCMASGACNDDADCSGGKWCNVSAHECTEKVANGSAVPTDAAHTDPTLDGKCTTEAATLTCASGVCDSTDNRCGYADGKGPCTAGNGGVVCRSGSCSVTGVCKPATACNVDSDCDTATQYCDTGVRACTAKLQNGTSMPAVKDHKPALDGKCSKEAAQIVCQSGVCDPADDKCGYGNGVGPCSVANAATVCRAGACDPKDNKCGLADESGPCSSDSVCRSNDCNETKRVCGSGCKADSECAADQYCKSDGTCSLKHPDGDKCAGANQCQSGGCENEVCDSVLAAGNGLACSVRAVNGSNGGAGAAVFGVMLAAAGLFRRRRSARS